MPTIVQVPFTTQLLALSVALQVLAFMAVFWRGFFGLKQLSSRRPRWPFIPLIVGTACGVWYAVIQSDLVFGLAQGLGLFIGFCLINSTRGERPQQFAGTRRERREAEREARRKAKRGEPSGE